MEREREGERELEMERDLKIVISTCYLVSANKVAVFSQNSAHVTSSAVHYLIKRINKGL